MSILGNKALKEALKRHFLCFEASFKAFTDILFMMTIKSFKLELSLGGHLDKLQQIERQKYCKFAKKFLFCTV
jgi:hypothetical protein